MITNTYLPVSNGSGNAALAHVQSARIIGSTTIALDTTANWPTYAIITSGTLLSNGFMDPTTTTDMYGHVSGTNFIIDGFAPGNTDNGNAAGQVVVIKPNTEWANMIAAGVQGASLFPEQFANFVEPAGGLWTIVSGLAGTQTVGDVWYQGSRYSIPAVASETFTASEDTYIDVNPATGGYTYVPVANGATEPAVTTSCVRVAKVVTGASDITSISQGAYNKPITATQIANNTIDYANLLSTIFSGQLLTYTNTGNGGGTGQYINLGGIKLCWGIGGDIGSYAGSNNMTASLPSGFFTTVTYAKLDVINFNSTPGMYGLTSYTTTVLNIYQGTALTAGNMAWIAIGT